MLTVKRRCYYIVDLLLTGLPSHCEERVTCKTICNFVICGENQTQAIHVAIQHNTNYYLWGTHRFNISLRKTLIINTNLNGILLRILFGRSIDLIPYSCFQGKFFKLYHKWVIFNIFQYDETQMQNLFCWGKHITYPQIKTIFYMIVYIWTCVELIIISSLLLNRIWTIKVLILKM